LQADNDSIISNYNAGLDNDNQFMAFRVMLPRRRQKKPVLLLVILLVIRFDLPSHSFIYHSLAVLLRRLCSCSTHLPKQTFEAFTSDFSVETTLDWLVRKSNTIFNVVKDFLPIHLALSKHLVTTVCTSVFRITSGITNTYNKRPAEHQAMSIIYPRTQQVRLGFHQPIPGSRRKKEQISTKRQAQWVVHDCSGGVSPASWIKTPKAVTQPSSTLFRHPTPLSGHLLVLITTKAQTSWTLDP
jgi:hypothetical protein